MKSKVTGRLLVSMLLVAALLATTGISSAAQPSVGLGTATSFAVLAGQTVTNTGPSIISGDVGVSPGSAVVGFPPGEVRDGTIHAADEVAAQAQADLTMAYDDAAGRTPSTSVSSDLGGQTLTPGVYKSETGMGVTGTVTLDGQNDPDAVFVFQAGSTLITASSSIVALVRGAKPCNVFWQVGSSATLATDSTFVGTVMALTSATVQTRATVQGRVFARNGQVTLDTNTITSPTCESETTSSTSTSTTQPDSSDDSSDGNDNGTDGENGDGGNGTREDGGNGTNENGGSTTMTPTGPGTEFITPTVENQQTENTLPKTGLAIAQMLALGAVLIVFGALMIRKPA